MITPHATVVSADLPLRDSADTAGHDSCPAASSARFDFTRSGPATVPDEDKPLTGMISRSLRGDVAAAIQQRHQLLSLVNHG